MFIVTFSTASGWLVINKKINALPNWQEMSYGTVQIFDNSKIISENFDKKTALVQDTSSLIGPVTLKYDLTFWAKNEEATGFKIKKYLWKFGEERREEVSPVIIYNFSQKGAFDVEVTVVGTDTKGDEIEKVIKSIQPVNISSIVKIEETITESGGKSVKFDADDLRELGKIDWYFIEKGEENTNEAVHTGYSFQPGKIIIEDTIIGMYIKRNGKTDKTLDKVFIISKEDKNDIIGKIEYTQDVVDDLKYTFSVTNANTNFGNGFIEEFIWKLEDKSFTNKSDIEDVEGSSEIEYNFGKYGEQKISVELVDSSGKTKKLNTTLTIPKRLKLKNGLRILKDSQTIENLRYDQKNNEYFIDELPVPSEIKLDARLLRTTSSLYSLTEVRWDINDDGNYDENTKLLNFDAATEGNSTIEGTFIFTHRKIKDDIVTIKQRVYIEAIKKDAILDLKIEPKNNYVPTTVKFDASASEVKGKNIEKFIFDYDDGVIEERDAINPSRIYTKHGEYDIKLSVVTTDGSTYSTSKKLVLKPKPQSVKIASSLKKAPTNQGIDFSSSESEGQIVSYFWDFGDGEVSTDANPSHAFEIEGDYTVQLKVKYQNNNVLTDQIDIEVIDE